MKEYSSFLHETLNNSIKNHPTKIALVFEGLSYSFSDLEYEIDLVVKNLIANNVKGNVGILLGNKPETIFSIYGVSKYKSTFVILNDKIKPRRLQEIIDNADITTIITDTNHLPVVENQSVKVLIPNSNEWKENQHRPLTDVSDDRQDNSIAALMYTSGSTGEPKGVICLHKNMIAAIDIINSYLYHEDDDVILTVLPLSHGYGLYQVLAPLAVGATVILENGFLFANTFLKKIKEMGATGFAVVPTILTMIFQVDEWEKYLSKLRYITNAGAGLPPSYHRKLLDHLPNTTRVVPMYGQTECVRALYLVEKDIDEKNIYSCGRAIPRTDLYLVDENFRKVELGEVGELIVHGPTVMAGYWKKPEETEKTFVKLHGETYLLTGDLFVQDDWGLYYYIGRKDDVVKIKGERTSPKELEDALYHMKGVKEVIAIPVPDPLWDNRLIVHLSSDIITESEVMKYCKKNLEPHMLPKHVVIYSQLPRNDNGKIDRKHLKQVSLEKYS